MSYLERTRAVGGLLIIATLMACGDNSPSDPTSTSDRVRLVAASAITSDGVVGTKVPGPRVSVLDSRQRPMRGITVRFTVIAGDGSIENTLVTTQDDGIAAAGLWTLGTRAGTNVIRAITSDSRTELLFYVSARPALTITTSLKHSQVGFPGAAVATPVVLVVDRYGNGVPQVMVSFAGTDGHNPARLVEVETSQYGAAWPESWTLGPTPGTYVVTASVSGATPLTFTAIAVDPSDVIATYDLATIDDRLLTPGFSAWIALTSGGQFIEETRGTNDEPLVGSGTYTREDSILTLTNYRGREEYAKLRPSSLLLLRDMVWDGWEVWLYQKRGS